MAKNSASIFIEYSLLKMEKTFWTYNKSLIIINIIFVIRYMEAKGKLEERATSNLVAIMAFISVVNYWR